MLMRYYNDKNTRRGTVKRDAENRDLVLIRDFLITITHDKILR